MTAKEYKKISVAMIAGNLEINGISSVIMNYCTHMDLNAFDVTILAGATIAESHRNLCRKTGIKVIELPNRKSSTLTYIKELDKELGKNHFDIIHMHGNQASMALELFLGWKHHIKIRIAHSHNTTCQNIKLHKLMKPFFNLLCTHRFACGELAGKWLFDNKPFFIIPNGFETEKFIFNEHYREDIRKELSIEGKFVIGHIGRINDQKNQTFLLDIFTEVAKHNENAILLMVGIGPKLEEIKKIVNKHQYRDRIILYGETTTPEKIYAAMDLFVFPSKYEGLPVTLLEAQINGLPCIISDVITKEAILSKQVKMLSLNDTIETWALNINSVKTVERVKFYVQEQENISKYNIMNTVKMLESKYKKYMKGSYQS